MATKRIPINFKHGPTRRAYFKRRAAIAKARSAGRKLGWKSYNRQRNLRFKRGAGKSTYSRFRRGGKGGKETCRVVGSAAGRTYLCRFRRYGRTAPRISRRLYAGIKNALAPNYKFVSGTPYLPLIDAQGSLFGTTATLNPWNIAELQQTCANIMTDLAIHNPETQNANQDRFYINATGWLDFQNNSSQKEEVSVFTVIAKYDLAAGFPVSSTVLGDFTPTNFQQSYTSSVAYGSDQTSVDNYFNRLMEIHYPLNLFYRIHSKKKYTLAPGENVKHTFNSSRVFNWLHLQNMNNQGFKALAHIQPWYFIKLSGTKESASTANTTTTTTTVSAPAKIFYSGGYMFNIKYWPYSTPNKVFTDTVKFQPPEIPLSTVQTALPYQPEQADNGLLLP